MYSEIRNYRPEASTERGFMDINTKSDIKIDQKIGNFRTQPLEGKYYF